MTDKSIYQEIKQSISSGNIALLSKEKLIQFQSALAQSPARLHFGAPQLQKICNTVEMHLASRFQEHTLQNNSNNHTNEKWYKKPIGIVILSVSGGVLVLLVKHYFGL